MEKESTFSEWCILELMGHRRLFGQVSEVQIGGASFLRLDVPGPDRPCTRCGGNGDGEKHTTEGTLPCLLCSGSGQESCVEATQYYNPAAVYCMTPTTEELARRMAVDNKPEPVSRWEVRALESPVSSPLWPLEDDESDRED